MAHPYQLLDPLPEDQYARLKADIRARGVLVPVEEDEAGNILDGHNRVQIWNELRAEGRAVTDYPRIVRSGMTEEEKRRHVRALNIYRRHLTREQVRALVEEQICDTPHISDRQIANEFGVSPTTVGTARQRVEERGDVSKLDTRTDTLGRQQPGQRRRHASGRPSRAAELINTIEDDEPKERPQPARPVVSTFTLPPEPDPPEDDGLPVLITMPREPVTAARRLIDAFSRPQLAKIVGMLSDYLAQTE